jgi:hypothetical protein
MAFQKRSLEAKHMGEEPDPRDWMEMDEEALTDRMHDSFRWYYKFYDFKETMVFVSEYYKKNKVKTTSPKKIKPIDLQEVGMHVGYIARLKTRGLDRCPEKLETLFIEKLKKIEDIANRRKNQQEEIQENKVKPDIQQRMRALAKKLAFDVEEVVEQQIDSGFKDKFNFKNFVKQNKITKPVAKHLKEEINLMAEEIRLAKDGDPDLKEAYSHLNGIIKNRLIKFYDNLIEECDNIQTVKKENIKPVKLNWYRRNKNKKKKKK